MIGVIDAGGLKLFEKKENSLENYCYCVKKCQYFRKFINLKKTYLKMSFIGCGHLHIVHL